jgi:ABC-type Na+ transport system ATPase subunit NatA
VRKLGGYPKDYINEAIERLRGEKSADKRSVRFIKLMKQQIDQATSGVREPKLWIGQAKELALQIYVK